MLFVIIMVLVSVAAGYLTSIPCRFAQSRGRRPGWYSAPLGVLGAALLAVLFIFQGDLFRPSTWDKNKMETPFLIPVYFTVFCCVGLTPAVRVVLHYQKKYGDAHPTASPGGFR